MDPSVKAKLEIALSTFGGGVGTFFVSHMAEGAPTTAQQWEAFGLGALGAGAIALYHRYQTAPSDVAAVKAAAARIAGAAVLVLAATLGCASSGCAAIKGWVQAHPTATPDLTKTAKCVADELAKDTAAGETPLAIGIDLGSTCGPDAIAVFEDVLAKSAASARPSSKAAALLAARRR